MGLWPINNASLSISEVLISRPVFVRLRALTFFDWNTSNFGRREIYLTKTPNGARSNQCILDSGVCSIGMSTIGGQKRFIYSMGSNVDLI